MKFALLFLLSVQVMANDQLPLCSRDKTPEFILCPDGVYQRNEVSLAPIPKDIEGCYPDQTPGYILCPDGVYEILRGDHSADRAPKETVPSPTRSSKQETSARGN